MLDTNVVLSGITARNRESPPARVLDAVLQGSIPCLVSSELIAEYRAVLGREQHGLSQTEVDDVVRAIVKVAARIEITSMLVEGPDPNDAHLWRLLRAQPNAILITGDRALLEQTPEGLRVMRPRAWIDEQ